MKHSLSWAALMALAAWLASGGSACGARADLGDDELASGGPGAGGAATAGPTGTGAGSSGTLGSAAQGTGGGGAAGASSGTGAATGSSSGTGAASGSTGSSSSSSSGAGGGEVCPGFGDACTGCLSGGCPATYCDCYNNGDCLALIKCANACNGDQVCQQGCLTAHGSGISDAYLLFDCAGTTCAGSCPGNKPAKPCSKCLFENCADEMNTCLAQPECLALYNCLTACGNVDLACQQQCYQDHGDGVMALQAVLMCSKVECPDTCN